MTDLKVNQIPRSILTIRSFKPKNTPERAFSSIDLVGQCLLDKQRTAAFEKAINNSVHSGMTVLDAGTGSGIMAMLAARAGASKVYAVELDPFVASIAKNNIKTNGLNNKIEIINGDMKSIHLKNREYVDVVIMEMLTVGMIDEQQISAIKQLKKTRIVDNKTIFLPERQKSFVSFGYSHFEMYGLKTPMILHLWDIHADINEHFSAVSNRVLFDDYYFSTDNRISVDAKVSAASKKTSKINCILLESESIINSNISIGETPALNGKVLIPIPEINIKKREVIVGKIKYKYGAGFESFSFNW